MKPLSVCLCIPNHVMVRGFAHILSESTAFDLCASVWSLDELRLELESKSIQCVLVDYEYSTVLPSDLKNLIKAFPSVAFVGITVRLDVAIARLLLQHGMAGHLLMDCDPQEIMDCIRETVLGRKFFCGKVVGRLNSTRSIENDQGCEAVSLSMRESEILQLVAQGMTTKQIATQLHLSFHTVMTHRKNIMSKLGLNNTAGLITYAVRENLISPNKFLFSESKQVS